MSPSIEALDAVGAPFDQGAAQGRALARQIVGTREDLRDRYGWFAWRMAGRRAHLGSGRPMQRFLPQLHERLRGIAAGAQVALRALELHENLDRFAGVASFDGTHLEGRFVLPAAAAERLALRASRPDAVGFASVELIDAGSAGCLAGVNEPGVGVVVIDERGAAGPAMRSYAQDLILRAQTAGTAAQHLRLRARYAGGSGTLLVADPSGAALLLELAEGELQVSEAEPRRSPIASSTVEIELDTSTLLFAGQRIQTGPTGPEALRSSAVRLGP